jgi:hypothetical protein
MFDWRHRDDFFFRKYTPLYELGESDLKSQIFITVGHRPAATDLRNPTCGKKPGKW